MTDDKKVAVANIHTRFVRELPAVCAS